MGDGPDLMKASFVEGLAHVLEPHSVVENFPRWSHWDSASLGCGTSQCHNQFGVLTEVVVKLLIIARCHGSMQYSLFMSDALDWLSDRKIQ